LETSEGRGWKQERRKARFRSGRAMGAMEMDLELIGRQWKATGGI